MTIIGMAISGEFSKKMRMYKKICFMLNFYRAVVLDKTNLHPAQEDYKNVHCSHIGLLNYIDLLNRVALKCPVSCKRVVDNEKIKSIFSRSHTLSYSDIVDLSKYRFNQDKQFSKSISILMLVYNILNMLPHKNKYNKNTYIPKEYILPLCIVHHDVIPEGYSLSGEWYPIQTNIQPLESKYTVHITEDGKCYHKFNCEKIKGYEIKYINIYKARINGRRPCSFCYPRKPQDTWYDEIKNIIKEDSELYEKIRRNPISTRELQNKLLELTDDEQANLETIKNNRIRDEIIGIFKTINWQKWTDSSYCDSDAYTRYDRAKKEPIKLLSYNEAQGKAKIKGTSGEEYIVSEIHCECDDFKFHLKKEAPCKHMYYLAMQLYNRKNIQ